MRDLLLVFGLLCAVFVLPVAGLVYFINAMNERECRLTAEAMGVEYLHNINIPCMIKPEGKPWVPLTSYRVL